ncbi:unnamed protein product, partial [Linum tenue]
MWFLSLKRHVPEDQCPRKLKIGMTVDSMKLMSQLVNLKSKIVKFVLVIIFLLGTMD